MSSVLLKKNHPVKWIRVSSLDVRWAEAQRGLNQRKVKKIADNLDPEALGVLVVTQENGNGNHHVVDGQHRAAAVRRFAGETERVPCLVVPASDPARAAEIWLKINDDRTRPQPMDRHHVAVTAGREENVAVQRIIEDAGYKLGMDGTDGTLSAITACLSIYKRHGGDTLVMAFRLIQETWGMQRESVHNNIVRGYADMVAQHGEDMDFDRLVSKVAKQYTPARLLGAAKTAREMFRGTITDNVVRVLVQTYNHGLRSDVRLPT